MQQQIELAGLVRSTLIRDTPAAQELFIRLPVKMTVYGTYHQLMRFFKSMGEIPRIVNIEDLKLNPANQGGGNAQTDKDLVPDALKADFVAVAFQYLDRQPAKKADTTMPFRYARRFGPAADTVRTRDGLDHPRE